MAKYAPTVRTARTSIASRMTPAILNRLDRVREVFKEKYPEVQFPSLSFALELALSRRLQDYMRDPEELERDVNDFKSRYARKTK